MSKPAEIPDRLLTAAELAGMLRLSPKTIQRLTGRGLLPCIRIGRSVRFAPGDVARWLEARKG